MTYYDIDNQLLICKNCNAKRQLLMINEYHSSTDDYFNFGNECLKFQKDHNFCFEDKPNCTCGICQSCNWVLTHEKL